MIIGGNSVNEAEGCEQPGRAEPDRLEAEDYKERKLDRKNELTDRKRHGTVKGESQDARKRKDHVNHK